MIKRSLPIGRDFFCIAGLSASQPATHPILQTDFFIVKMKSDGTENFSLCGARVGSCVN